MYYGDVFTVSQMTSEELTTLLTRAANEVVVLIEEHNSHQCVSIDRDGPYVLDHGDVLHGVTHFPVSRFWSHFELKDPQISFKELTAFYLFPAAFSIVNDLIKVAHGGSVVFAQLQPLPPLGVISAVSAYNGICVRVSAVYEDNRTYLDVECMAGLCKDALSPA